MGVCGCSLEPAHISIESFKIEESEDSYVIYDVVNHLLVGDKIYALIDPYQIVCYDLESGAIVDRIDLQSFDVDSLSGLLDSIPNQIPPSEMGGENQNVFIPKSYGLHLTEDSTILVFCQILHPYIMKYKEADAVVKKYDQLLLKWKVGKSAIFYGVQGLGTLIDTNNRLEFYPNYQGNLDLKGDKFYCNSHSSSSEGTALWGMKIDTTTSCVSRHHFIKTSIPSASQKISYSGFNRIIESDGKFYLLRKKALYELDSTSTNWTQLAESKSNETFFDLKLDIKQNTLFILSYVDSMYFEVQSINLSDLNISLEHKIKNPSPKHRVRNATFYNGTLFSYFSKDDEHAYFNYSNSN